MPLGLEVYHQDSFPADVSSLMMDSMGLKKIVQSQQPLRTVRQVATVKPMVPKIGWTMDIGDKMEDCCSLESIGFIARPPALIVCQEMGSKQVGAGAKQGMLH